MGMLVTETSQKTALERSLPETRREPEMTEPITIRHSTPADQDAIRRLAALDDRPAPKGESVLAFVAGDLRVARSVDRSRTVADPFHPTDEVVQLVKLWAADAAA